MSFLGVGYNVKRGCFFGCFIFIFVWTFVDDVCAELRTWTLVDGKKVNAEFVSMFGKKVLLRNSKGAVYTFSSDRFSPKDILFIELEKPPKFTVDFIKTSDQYIWPQRAKLYADWELPGTFDYVFGVRLKQVSAEGYAHELFVEYFVIGEEIDGNNYIFLDHQEFKFVPSEQDDREITHRSEKTVRLFDYNFFQDGRRGQKYGGYLIVVKDLRGEVILHKSNYNWIYERVKNLRNLPIRCHFNKTCVRVFPPRPKAGRQ